MRQKTHLGGTLRGIVLCVALHHTTLLLISEDVQSFSLKFSEEVWMRNCLCGILIFAAALLSSAEGFSKDKPQQNSTPPAKSVEWIDIRVPKLSPVVSESGASGTVTIDVEFKGCDLDPANPRVVSGMPLLAPVAMESLKQSILTCGNFANSHAILYYEFELYKLPNCKYRALRMEVEGTHIRVVRSAPCIED